MAKRWEHHAIPDRAASDAHSHQQRLSVVGLHQRAHSVAGPYHTGARHHHQQTVRPVSADCQRREGPPPIAPGYDYGQRGPGNAAGSGAGVTSEYRTPSAAEFYAGVWQPPSSPRHSHVPSVGGYQAPEQPVYAVETAPTTGMPSQQPMSPPYTPAPGISSFSSPAFGHAYSPSPPPPPTPSSPYQYQRYQLPPYQTQPFSPLSPQHPSGLYQAYQSPAAAPFQQPQEQYVAYRPPAPPPKPKYQSDGPSSAKVAQSFAVELPANEAPLTRAEHAHQGPVELPAESQAGKEMVVGEDDAERWADEQVVTKRFEQTIFHSEQSYLGKAEAPAPLRICKSTTKMRDDTASSVEMPTGPDEAVESVDKKQLDPVHLIHQHLWSGSR